MQVQVRKSRTPLPEFRVVKLNNILPELIAVSECKKPASYRVNLFSSSYSGGYEELATGGLQSSLKQR
jgi:hypothetical protein